MGWAIWHKGQLHQCGLARGKHWLETLDDMPPVMVKEVICEEPVIYPRSSVNPASILLLAHVAGAVAGLYHPAPYYQVKPRTWKGTMPKVICNARTFNKLERIELTLTDTMAESVPRSLVHNVIDAIGVGLWHLKRR